MTLPRALWPWREELDELAPELAMSLGPWLHRLHTLIGPLRSHRSGGDGEPDGYNNLHRRGSYEQLLLSEWLLADAEPMEFLRRASQGEHLFLELARRAPVRRERVVVLVDAGVEQIGLPRLAQLAALMVLHGRARAGDALFSWGVLHRPGRLESGSFGETAVRGFLSARHGAPPMPEWLDGWGAQLDELDDDDELWLLAGDVGALPQALARATHLYIEEPLVGEGAREVELRLRTRGHSERHALLRAPDDTTCARLLRDPFQRVVAAPARETLAAEDRVLLSWNGTRLFARLEDGTIAAWHVPNTPNEPQGRTRYLPPPEGGRIVAVGYRRRFFGVAMLSTPELAIWEHGRWWPTNTMTTETDSLSLQGCWLADRDGTVFATSQFCRLSASRRGVRPSSWTVWRCTAERLTSTTLISEEERHLAHHVAADGEADPSALPLSLDADPSLDAFMSQGGPGHAMAVAHRESGWLMVSDLTSGGARALHLFPPEEAMVIGVVWHGGQFCLLLREAREFSVVGRNHSARLFSAPDPVVDAHVSPAGRVACKTAAGEILVYCSKYGDLVLRQSGGSR